MIDIPYWVLLDTPEFWEQRKAQEAHRLESLNWPAFYHPRWKCKTQMSPYAIAFHEKHYPDLPLIPWDDYVKSRIIKLWDWTGIE